MGLLSVASAQDPIHFSTKNGLPTNHVYDMVQDLDGYMWFATNRGVVKYDGVNFRTFTTQDGLPNNDVFNVEIDPENRIWFFSKSKYQGFIRGDSVHVIQVSDRIVSQPYLYSTDPEWLVGFDGFYKVEADTLVEITILSTLDSLSRTISQMGTQKHLYFNTGGGFFCVDDSLSIIDENGSILVSIPQRILFDKSLTRKVRNISKDVILICSDLGVSIFNMKDRASIPFEYLYKDLWGSEFTLERAVKLTCNNVQVTIPGHLWVFSNKGDLINYNDFSELYPGSLIYQDEQKNIWARDLSKGVFMISQAQVVSDYYMRDTIVQKIAMSPSGLIVGVPDQGFYRMDTTFSDISFIEGSEVTGYVYDIKSTGDSELLLVAGTVILSLSEKSVRPLETLQILRSNDGGGSNKDILIKGDTIHALHGIGKSTSTKDGEFFGLDRSIVFRFIDEFNDKIYVGGNDGLFILKGSVATQPSDLVDFARVPITSMTKNADYLVIGTDGRGVYFYREGDFKHIKDSDGLIVQRCIFQDDSLLWLATQRGVQLVRLDPGDLSESMIIDSYYEEDGLIDNNTNDIQVVDSFLIVASNSGLAKINLNNPIYDGKPQIRFIDTQWQDEYTREESSVVSVSFGPLDFVNKDRYKYSYRLLPEQSEWQLASTNTLLFNSLDPGKYRIELRATDQHFNTGMIHKDFVITPAWWQTIWANLAFVLLGIASLYGAFLLMQKRIRNKEREKTDREKRISGLELQALRSQMNPHFVHNSLNAIQYFIQRNEVDKSEEYLVRFSRLIRLFFEYSRLQVLTIEQEVELLENYLFIEKLRFEDKLTYVITVDDDIEKDIEPIPSMILQPIVENAVNHGLFHLMGAGEVNIHFNKNTGNTLVVTVKDNGVGIVKAREYNIKSAHNYRSRSSDVINERLDLLNQGEEWNVDYTIYDQSTEQGNTGTKVVLNFNKLT